MRSFSNSAPRHNARIDEIFHQLNQDNIVNVVYWWQNLQMVRDVPGDIVECGLGRGRSLIILCVLNHILGSDGGDRTIYEYDSFAGFPAPAPQDKSSRAPKQGDWSRSPSGRYEYTEEFARTVLSEAGIETPPIFVKGFFKDTVASHPDRPIAVLHVDCDLYQSHLDVLGALYDKVAPGGIIIFDDFMLTGDAASEKFPGARQATREFLGDRFSALKPTLRGTPLYVKPTSSTPKAVTA